MSRMQQEITQCMLGLEVSAENEVRARFSFPEGFIGFQGHFENNPVLPGICKIQAVVAMYEKARHQSFRLREVNLAKYFTPVTCGQEITVQCHSSTNEDGSTGIKAAIQREGGKVAMLQLVIENAKS